MKNRLFVLLVLLFLTIMIVTFFDILLLILKYLGNDLSILNETAPIKVG